MGHVALLHNPRLSRVMALCVAGVLGCALSLALAGPTPQPPMDPIDALPAGVARAREWTCASSLADAVTPTVTSTGAPGPTEPQPCWHIALVRSPTETANELADRLAKHYTTRGFEFSGTASGDIRSLTGMLAQCGTTLALDTGDQGAFSPPGTRASLPALPGAIPPGAIPPGAIPPGAIAGGAPVDDPTASTVPGAPDPNASIPMDQTQSSIGQPVDPDALDQISMSNPSALLAYLQPGMKGSVVILASQQARAVVPRALEGRC
jgi:hypothetical protein